MSGLKMIKVSRILVSKGRIEEKYSRSSIIDALKEYIMEVLSKIEPINEFKVYVAQNFGPTYHLLDDFELDEGLWSAAINGLKGSHQIEELEAIQPHTASFRKLV